MVCLDYFIHDDARGIRLFRLHGMFVVGLLFSRGETIYNILFIKNI